MTERIDCIDCEACDGHPDHPAGVAAPVRVFRVAWFAPPDRPVEGCTIYTRPQPGDAGDGVNGEEATP